MSVINIFKIIEGIFSFFVESILNVFGTTVADIMQSSLQILDFPLVKNTIKYAQILALSLLAVKTVYEAFQTYILHENGDPDADPTGLLVRTGQAVAIILSSEWILRTVFEWGSKVASDVGGIGTGLVSMQNIGLMLSDFFATMGGSFALLAIIVLICFLVVYIQATIRGAELALMAVVGPILALNITANNRSTWSAYFKQLLVVCTAQALQIFMLKGAIYLITTKYSIFIIIGWLWVTIKTPKFLQQFTYSTGFTGAVGGGVKQAGTMVLMRKMMTKGG